MSAPVQFTELRVRRMPGFEERGFDLTDLTPGINLVYGPNASGKSSAARALQRLLWPADGEQRVWVSGRFRLDGARWRVEVDGARVAWERDGESAARPSLPPASARSRYLLSLTELLRADDGDLAERIRVESAGGFDVTRAATALGLEPGGRPVSLLRALERARARLDEASIAAGALREERRRLTDLRYRRGEAEEAAALETVLERALDLDEARERVAAARRDLAAYPPGMARLQGNEIERLDEWGDRDRTLRTAAAKAEAEAESAAEERAAAGLGDDGVAASAITTLERKLETLRRLDATVEAAERERDEAGARRERTERLLGVPAGDGPSDLAPPDADRLDAFLDRAQRVRERTAALDAWIGILGGPRHGGDPDAAGEDAHPDVEDAAPYGGGHVAPPDMDALRHTARLLRDWLRLGGDAARRKLARLVDASIAGFLGLAVALVAAGAVGRPDGRTVYFGFAVVAGAAGILLYVLRPRPTARRRDGVRGELERQGEALDQWTEDRVRERLDATEKRIAIRTLEAQRRVELDRRMDERAALDREAESVDEERSALARALGLDPGSGDLGLVLTATRLREWDAARIDEVAARQQLETAVRARDSSLAGARAVLEPFGYAPEGAEELAGAVAGLRARRERHERAGAALRSADREIDRIARERAELSRRRQALLEGVAVADEVALRELAGGWKEWKEARNTLELARRARDGAEAGLLDAIERREDGEVGSGLVAELTSAPREALERRLADARNAAGEERELGHRIAGIEARLADARSREEVEGALAELARARADLAGQRERDVDDAIGQAMAEWLSGQISEVNRPAVFHRARRLLASISRGRFVLELGEDGGFRARDTVARRVRSLDELSSGTRIQLLLAVRVAFIETLEQGSAPPLLLDEVLANADDRRARAIIDAAIGLARAGRQLFYFTAQADELARWQDALTNAPDVSWARCTLSDAEPDTALAEELPEPPRPVVPDPDGRSHADYGALLDVPAWDPWAGDPAPLHLWYLIEDVDALHRLLSLGIERWGQLQAFGRHAPAAATPALEGLEDAARTADLCQRYGELWRQGRGRPVDRAALEASGAITATFMDRVAALCEELHGDGAALVQALERGEIPHFRVASAEALQDWLTDRGHIDEATPLDETEIQLRLTAGLMKEAGEAGMPEPGVEAIHHRVRRLVRRLRKGSVGEPDHCSAEAAAAS